MRLTDRDLDIAIRCLAEVEAGDFDECVWEDVGGGERGFKLVRALKEKLIVERYRRADKVAVKQTPSHTFASGVSTPHLCVACGKPKGEH